MPFENSPKAKLVYDDLQREKKSLEQAQTFIPSGGIGSSRVVSYTIPPAALDKNVLEKIVVINQKKLEIKNLAEAIFNARGNNGGPCGIASTVKDDGTPNDFFVADENQKYLSAVDKDSVEMVDITISDPLYGNVNWRTLRAKIREDALFAFGFPALENNDTSVMVPVSQDQEDYIRITNSNLGAGKTNYLVSDRDDVGNKYSTVGQIDNGYFYALKNPSGAGGICEVRLNTIVGIGSSINDLRDEIEGMFPEINTLKDAKHKEQIQKWFEQKSLNDISGKLTVIQDTVAIMEQNEADIVAYEQSQSP